MRKHLLKGIMLTILVGTYPTILVGIGSSDSLTVMRPYDDEPTATCYAIPGSLIIDAYCASSNKPFVFPGSSVYHGEKFVSNAAERAECTNPVKRAYLKGRKLMQQSPYYGERTSGAISVRPCNYKFHIGSKNDPNRQEYNFTLERMNK